MALRTSEPGPDSGAGLGFGPDGRAAGTAYEALGAAWAYASPWYFVPDALSGTAAAATVPGPILLVGTDEISNTTAEELRRLAPQRIVVLGGSNRFGTCALISQEAFIESDHVVIASGADFPDALSSGPVAFMVSGPVLLVSRMTVSERIDAEVRRLKPTLITIAGGDAAVSRDVEQQLGGYHIR